MEVNKSRAILFVDLDEVMVTRLFVSSNEETIVIIQPIAEKNLKDLIGQLLILTHRTRKEALQIINKINELKCFSNDVVAAEDIIRAALITGQFFSLLRYGIKKKFYLPIAQRKYGLKPEKFAILDDSPAHVEGILARGGGLGLLAPKPKIIDGEVTTFDFDTALAKYKSFRDGKIFGQQCIKLEASRQYPISTLKRFKLVRAHRTNYIRRGAKTIRSALFKM